MLYKENAAVCSMIHIKHIKVVWAECIIFISVRKIVKNDLQLGGFKTYSLDMRLTVGMHGATRLPIDRFA